VGQVFAKHFDLADSPEIWATRIAAAADLPDQRLNTRLADVLSMLARQPKDAIPQAARSSSHAKSVYRFFSNERFPYDVLTEAVGRVTANGCAGYDRVYVVHDSSSLNYSSLKATTGLGRLNGNAKTACGLIVHSVLAVNSDGIVRGVLSVDLWARPEEKTRAQRYDRPFADKESFKWVRGMRSARAAFETAVPSESQPRRTHIMDREGDIHEVFADILAHGEGAIIRCAQNRKVAGDLDRAHAAVADSPLRGQATLTVRQADGSLRKAQVQLRALSVRLTPSSRDYPGRQRLSLNLIEVRETKPPGTEPVLWRLWTTEAIDTWQDILERMREYSLRWRIEEYHLALKSGCNTEGLLLEKAERLCKAIVLYAAVAARIVALRDWGRHAPDMPCTVLLSAEECRVLTGYFAADLKKGTATTVQTPIMDRTPTIRQAMVWIGRLGGHLGRKRDGLPGVRTLWRGWRDLAIMVYGYRLRHQRL
jgi:Transposase DNA-binding/Transposase Tn5 dimerisation domain